MPTNDIEKVKRKLFIFENIGVSLKSRISAKEKATKRFLKLYPDYTAYEVCTTIGLARGTFHNFLNNKVETTWFAAREKMLKKEITTIFNESNGTYGQDRIQIALKQKGINASTNKIAEIMRKNKMKVKSNRQRPTIKEMNQKRKINHRKNLINQQFEQDAPNNVWVSDFMELRVKDAKFYICVVLDLYSRKVIAWRLSHNCNDHLAVNTFKDAFEDRGEPKNLVFHSDQGSQFTSKSFMDTLKMLEVKQSFSRPGYPFDNACMESFYSTLRREETNINYEHYENSRIIKEYLNKYFTFYNTKRIRTFDRKTPQQKEDEYYESH